MTSSREHSNSAQEFSQLFGTASIKLAVGPIAESSDITKCALRDWIKAVLEHKNWHTQNAELSSQSIERGRVLLHGVANKNQRLDWSFAGFGDPVLNNFGDLGLSSSAVDGCHMRKKIPAAAGPGNCSEFHETAVIRELHIEATKSCLLYTSPSPRARG